MRVKCSLYIASEELALFYDFRREATYVAGEARILKKRGAQNRAIQALWADKRVSV